LRSLSPFVWSNAPWDIPNTKIKIKQTKEETLKLLYLKNIIEKILLNKKKIKE
tara:strand:+ start:34 stop:192 length:159 start_codon:yes stop_codon:yes gene_type:complete